VVLLATHVILLRNPHVLFARRYNTGYADGCWSLPAGHVEAGESVTAASVREIHEETGVIVAPQELSVVHVQQRAPLINNASYVNFFFVTSRWDGEPVIQEPHKCDRLLWQDVSQRLPENTVDYVRAAFDHITVTSRYSEYGW
jgi:8-oxo-dGTP diphosphatase